MHFFNINYTQYKNLKTKLIFLNNYRPRILLLNHNNKVISILRVTLFMLQIYFNHFALVRDTQVTLIVKL